MSMQADLDSATQSLATVAADLAQITTAVPQIQALVASAEGGAPTQAQLVQISSIANSAAAAATGLSQAATALSALIPAPPSPPASS